MVWLDLDVEPDPDTGTPSVEAHSCAVKLENFKKKSRRFNSKASHPQNKGQNKTLLFKILRLKDYTNKSWEN